MKIECAHKELRDITSLVPHPRNPNKHPKKQIQLLAKILKHQGWRNPIVVSKRSGFVVSGHGRLEAAKLNGWEKVPVDIQEFATEADEYAHIVADNAIAELADLDKDLIAKELKDLNFDLDIDLLGFEDFDFKTESDEEKEKTEDEVPETPKEPKSKLGDLYELGEHRLLCGDSTVRENVDKLMNGEKADMVFTDPPYGIGEKGDRLSRGGDHPGQFYKDFKDDSTKYAIDAFNLCDSLNIKNQVWFGANYYCHSLPEQNNWLVWDKREKDSERNKNSDCELAWVKSKANSVRIFRHKWKGMIKASENGQKRVHPTQKPIVLAEWCFNEYKSGDNILDLFGGSGSTLIACEKTKRKCFMMELDPHYIDVIVSRYVKYTGNNKIKLNGQEIQW